MSRHTAVPAAAPVSLVNGLPFAGGLATPPPPEARATVAMTGTVPHQLSAIPLPSAMSAALGASPSPPARVDQGAGSTLPTIDSAQVQAVIARGEQALGGPSPIGSEPAAPAFVPPAMAYVEPAVSYVEPAAPFVAPPAVVTRAPSEADSAPPLVVAPPLVAAPPMVPTAAVVSEIVNQEPLTSAAKASSAVETSPWSQSAPAAPLRPPREPEEPVAVVPHEVVPPRRGWVLPVVILGVLGLAGAAFAMWGLSKPEQTGTPEPAKTVRASAVAAPIGADPPPVPSVTATSSVSSAPTGAAAPTAVLPVPNRLPPRPTDARPPVTAKPPVTAAPTPQKFDPSGI